MTEKIEKDTNKLIEVRNIFFKSHLFTIFKIKFKGQHVKLLTRNF